MHSPRTTPTALLLVDLQLGLTHPSHPGTPRSTPNLETNITSLLSACRTYNTNNTTTTPPQSPFHPITIIHIHHHSINPSSHLHPTHIINWSPNTNPFLNGTTKGIHPLPCATPLPNEPILTKSVNSSFIGTDLESRLRRLGIRQVLVVGTTTEHCVSTTVRMAANLNVVGDPEGYGEKGVVLVRDGCGAFGRVDAEGRVVVDGETVHWVEVEVLRGEFCEVVDTALAVEVITGVGGGGK